MALTNKDGTPYKLRHPNKLAKEQTIWDFDKEKFILHNCNWQSEQFREDTSILVPRKSDFKVIPPQKPEVTPITPSEEVKISDSVREIEPAPTPKPEPVVEKQVSQPKTRQRLMPELDQPKEAVEALESLEEFVPKKHDEVDAKHIVIFHCQPAVIRDSTDELYGEEYRTIKRGDKFSFEGVITELDDMRMSFWTNIQLGEASVVFPSKDRRGRSIGQYRWWAVKSSEEHMGGFLHHCMFSDYQPDFSD